MLMQLKPARIKSNKTLQEVSRDLKIRRYYLEALEEGNTKLLPGEIYVKGYLKLYADYLGIADESEQLNLEKNLDIQSGLYDKTNNITTDYKYRKHIIILSVVMLPIVITVYYIIIK